MEVHHLKPHLPVDLGMGPKGKTSRAPRNRLYTIEKRKSNREKRIKDEIQESSSLKVKENNNISCSDECNDEPDKKFNFSESKGSVAPKSIELILPQEPKSVRAPSARRNICTDDMYENIQSYIERELKYAKNDSNRVYVYQRAFEKVGNEFLLCKPLLDKIRQEYDRIARNLIAKKREIMADTQGSTDAEDNYSELVTKMRKARNTEFKKTRAESEKLLDELIDLRLERSSLMHANEGLTKQLKDLTSMERIQKEQVLKLNTDLQSLIESIKIYERETDDMKHDIAHLQAKLRKTEDSRNDLQFSYETLLKQLDVMQKRYDDVKDKYDKSVIESEEVDRMLLETSKLVFDTERKYNVATDQYQTLKDRHEVLESKMREILREAGLDDTSISVNQIIENIVRSKTSG